MGLLTIDGCNMGQPESTRKTLSRTARETLRDEQARVDQAAIGIKLRNAMADALERLPENALSEGVDKHLNADSQYIEAFREAANALGEIAVLDLAEKFKNVLIAALNKQTSSTPVVIDESMVTGIGQNKVTLNTPEN